MKKYFLAAFLFTFICFTYISTDCLALDSQYDTIKVGIYYSGSAKDSINVSSSDGFDAGYMDGQTFVPVFGFKEASLDISRLDSSNITINGTSFALTGGNFAVRGLNGFVNIGGTVYHGGAEVIPDSSGKLTVINFVDLENYVSAVVSREMNYAWPREALNAQALCARTYAVSSWKRHLSLGFNLCAAQDCQTYLGIATEADSTIQAAAATKGQVIKYNSSVISALFSSSNGGSVGYSKYVWGNDIPYLVAKEDPYENPKETSYSPWSVTMTCSDIKSRLSKSGINIGEVTDVEVSGADEFGRVYKVTISGTSGTHELLNDKTRSFFGLNSQKYTIASANGSGQTAYGKTSVGVGVVPSEATVIHSGGFSKLSSFSAKGISGNKDYTFETATPAGTFVFNGSGWGHGLGMSQYGAKGMADKGFTYKDIISFYYPGTYIE